MMKLVQDNDRLLNVLTELDQDSRQILDFDSVDLADLLANADFDAYLAMDAEEVVGFCSLYPMLDAGCLNTVETSVCTLRGYRNRGYGRKIVDLTEKLAQERGMEFTVLSISPENTNMLKLSKSKGYLPASEFVGNTLFFKGLGV